MQNSVKQKIGEAELEVTTIDIRSAWRVSAFFSTGLAIVFFVLILLIYFIFLLMGTVGRLNSAFGSPISDNGAVVTLGIVLLFAVCFGVFVIVLGTFLGVAGAFLYNRSTQVLGGLKITGQRMVSPVRKTSRKD